MSETKFNHFAFLMAQEDPVAVQKLRRNKALTASDQAEVDRLVALLAQVRERDFLTPA